MMKRKFYLLLALTVLLVGCAATPRHVPPAFTVHRFSAPLDIELKAGTGQSIFVDGSYVQGEYIPVDHPVDMMIPGSMYIPFPVHVGVGRLVLTRFSGEWKYYCGDLATSAASFPGLGSVVQDGDCIGVRISNTDGTMQWVVDNSIHNGMTTIWKRNFSDEDRQSYKPQQDTRPFAIQSVTRINFDGYYGGQLHFTWEQVDDADKTSRKFVFDFAGEPTLVGINDKLLEVIQADNVGVRYRWKKL
ncbi:hypothetical protein EKL30_18445 [Candidimonas sp. SYP-B2681]|uniref:hypothetical protein n=1 Tax=Candidimonas sp. SYP-B2681 TaxID=2497686 RepID=UPI000F8921C1|nr:hypothetical protein [Candidimonas sp. SYP-B2681]RTZ39136.1 hypothetical protein EKL30_18445 [Candidimonas sp. SYP-B2681]